MPWVACGTCCGTGVVTPMMRPSGVRTDIPVQVPCPDCGGRGFIETPAPSALKDQVSGTHYRDMAIQPVTFITANRIGFIEGNIIKYACRHRQKGGRQDIEKIIHYARLLLELDYPEDKTP